MCFYGSRIDPSFRCEISNWRLAWMQCEFGLQHTIFSIHAFFRQQPKIYTI